MCMNFCYFDNAYEVYSDEEGVQKAINGYVYGDTRGKDRNTHLKKVKIDLDQETNRVTDPVLAPILLN